MAMAETTPQSAVPERETSNKRDRTSSPSDAPSPKENRLNHPSAGGTPAAEAVPEEEEEEEEGTIEADDGDSAFGDSSSSEGTSVRSSTITGYVENGRRYATLRGEGEVYLPSDEKQFEVFETTHLIFMILDSQRKNTLFQSPISDKAQYALDIGTGDASWPIDVADRFPNLTVYGIDLYPPPKAWVPPNCILEVDDATKSWTFSKKFDLITIRFMMGSFSTDEWKNVYRQAYENLQPGGWIEAVEFGTQIYSDDSTLPASSHLAKFHEVIQACGVKANKPMDVYDHFQQWIAETGFTNLQKTDYKVPIGEWPRLQTYKDAGRVTLKTMKAGLEGWLIWFLTKHGDPKPWSPDQVQTYLEFLRKELDSNWHIYQRAKRVWAQRPFDVPEETQDTELEGHS